MFKKSFNPFPTEECERKYLTEKYITKVQILPPSVLKEGQEAQSSTSQKSTWALRYTPVPIEAIALCIREICSLGPGSPN